MALDAPFVSPVRLHKRFFQHKDASFGRVIAKHLLGRRDPTYLLVSLYSLGDTYLLCGHARLFRELHCRAAQRLVIAIRRSHAAVVEMFADAFDQVLLLSDRDVDRTAAHLAAHGIKSRFAVNEALFVHPNHMNDTRVDDFTLIEGVSQAHMYANLMRLPIESPIATPTLNSQHTKAAEMFCRNLGVTKRRSVVLFPDSNSWPRIPDEFWEHLSIALAHAGWTVFTNASGSRTAPRRDPLPASRLADIPLELTLPTLAYAGWAVGTICGLMNVVVSSQTDCKKTILSRGPAVGEELVFDERLRLRSAFPYAFQRKFDGRNYDIEEIQIRDGTDYRQAAIDIARGFNAHEKSKPVPGPVRRMMVDVPPGEIADRITVLEVKLEKLPPQQQLLVLKELSILRATFESFANGIDAALEDKIKLLRDLNREGWDQNEIIYRIFDDPRIGAVGWSLDPNNMEAVGTATVVTRAFRASQAANRRRISVKNDINRMLKCTWLEQKSFES